MADRTDPPRRRTFYDEYPDYRRPRLEVPPPVRERMRDRLQRLYGARAARAWLPELERILTVHHAHKPPEMLEKERDYDPGERFCQEHIILITYGDIVQGEGPTPLATLHRFVDTYTDGAINTLHLLPFFPYSSDRGFAVIDYRRVDERLGSWADIRDHKRRYDLMFDAVLNHCSSYSEMFQAFLNGDPAYRDFFLAFESPEALNPEQRRRIFRPRTSDILTRYETIHGPRWVWTTFSADQIDLNYRNPAVLMQVVRSILFYIRRGADLLRLDAVTYLWDQPGTESTDLPQSHEIVKLLRDVVDVVASGVALVTETNIPHRLNISYFGDGYDEAHLVYNFALPPLVLYAFYTGDASHLTRWAEKLQPPSDRTAFLNILDTHDGIGLQGVRGLLSDEEIGELVATARGRGALISYKSTGVGGKEPYEINSTWWSALNPTEPGEDLGRQVRRYLASRSIPLVLRGVPGLYIHGLLGSVSDHRKAELSGEKRDVNRGTIDAAEVERAMADPGSKIARLREHGRTQLLARRRERALHSCGSQRVLELDRRVFALRRTSPEEDEQIITLTNVSGSRVEVAIPLEGPGAGTSSWRELLTDRGLRSHGDRLPITLEPFGRAWLKPAGG